MINAAVRESGGVTCLAVGGAGEPGTSGCLLVSDSRLWSSFLAADVGESGEEDLSASGGGGDSVGATSFLICGDESYSEVGFSI